MALTFQELLAQLGEIDKVSDEMRRAALIIRRVDEGIVVLKDSQNDDPDLKLALTQQQKMALLAPYVTKALALIDDAKTRAAGIQTA